MCSKRKSPALQIENISKNYETPQGTIQALQNLSANIEKGSCVGIIGHNGSGKSTLLRLIAQHTTLSTGTIHIQGNIAAILDIGTGFHPDLSGKENVILCGKLMGLPTSYILQQLPKIIQFSGMQKWIHRPVKQYSQGMFVRLAFAITTQLKADIFLFDEVLSIGDYAFQQQCLSQIQTLKKQNKTLLIVSHDLHTILQIVDHFLLLKHGKLQYFGKDSAPL